MCKESINGIVGREDILVCIIGNVGNTGIRSNVYLEVFK